MARVSVRALAPAALLLALGCNDYNFNPVGHCLIQPGTERFTLSSVATADILFVVDDSGSMAGEQDNLAKNFGAFVGELTTANQERVSNGLEPIDFHIAVTTTSIFLNAPAPNVSCSDRCSGANGQLVCCGNATNTPYTVARTCAGGGACGSGFSCRTDCAGHAGEAVCCDASKTPEQATVACTTAGDLCGQLSERFSYPRGTISCFSNADCDGTGGFTCKACKYQGTALPGNVCCNAAGDTPQIGVQCTPGPSTEGALYPQGDFVSANPSGTPNPKVLHFSSSLYKPVTNQAAIDALSAQFQQNVHVGTCGSGQEQAIQASRLAIQKALAGQQTDYDATGKPVKADWPHANSKLIVVYVGDEDDCSSPDDPSKALLLQLVTGNGADGTYYSDSCQRDSLLPPDQQKEYPISEFASFLHGLGRPIGGGFIVSAIDATGGATCQDAGCTAGICCDNACSVSEGWGNICTTDVCGGQGPGRRYLQFRDAIRAFPEQPDVVAGSICNPDFSSILKRLADIVKPPSALTLPTMPAAGDVTLLRITDASGLTRRTCKGPAPAGTTLADATANYDWWFVAVAKPVTDAEKTPVTAAQFPSQYVYINHATQRCEANPGETYSADYLGIVPAATASNPLGGCASAADCTAALGGTASSWSCETGGLPRGTCLCSNLQ